MAGKPSAAGKPTLVFGPGQRSRLLNAREVWQSRDLLWMLAVRDIRIRYRQTALGVTWVIAQPLLSAAILAFVFGRVARLPSDGQPYFPFAFAAMVGWTLFSTCLLRVSNSFVSNATLIAKVYFPRLVLPLAVLMAPLVDFAIGLLIVMLIIVSTDVGTSWAVLTLPVWAALLVALALGVGMVAAAVMVSYRDVQHILPVVLQFLLFASPIAYSVAAIPEDARPIYGLNPLVGLIQGLRWSLIGTTPPLGRELAWSIFATMAALVIGLVTLRRMERRFADVI